MAAPSAQLGDALVSWLNNGARAWPTGTGGAMGTWTATRTWNEELDEEAAGLASGMNVQVVMESKEGGQVISRAYWQEDFIGIIGIRQRYSPVTPIPQQWIDDRVELVEAIEKQMRRLDLTASLSGYEIVYIPLEEGISVVTLRDRIDYDNLRQFTAMIEFRLRTVVLI